MQLFRKATAFSFLFILLITAVGCVSVNIGSEKAKKADDLKFQAPEPPFHPLKADNADLAWQSEKTGNTIAFVSECKTSTDSELKTIEADSLTALDQIKIVSSKTSEFNDRESLETTADGQVDGIPVRLQLTVFKKNNCNYTLSYVGRRKFFDSEKSEFEKFRKGFVAP